MLLGCCCAPGEGGGSSRVDALSLEEVGTLPPVEGQESLHRRWNQNYVPHVQHPSLPRSAPPTPSNSGPQSSPRSSGVPQTPGSPGSDYVSRQLFTSNDSQEPLAERFQVVLDPARSSDTRLGLDVAHKPGALKVKRVKQGMVARWNNENPNFVVNAGDHIVNVNDVAEEKRSQGEWATSKDLLQAMTQVSGNLVLLIDRKIV